jgi:hypothetical protein
MQLHAITLPLIIIKSTLIALCEVYFVSLFLSFFNRTFLKKVLKKKFNYVSYHKAALHE